MPPKVYNIDVRSADRNRDLYPNAEDFVIDLGRDYKNVTSLKLGSLEVPNTRFSIEEQDNTMYFNEGFHIGTHDMEQPFNALKKSNGRSSRARHSNAHHEFRRDSDHHGPATRPPAVFGVVGTG